MFRHKGKRRAYIHNLRLASMLSCVAGMVNVCGVLGLRVLTTNVTGHFAYFAEEFSKEAFKTAFIFLLFIFFFLLGAFISNTLVEVFSRLRPKMAYALPLSIEISILATIGFFADDYGWGDRFNYFLACALLFAMGMQNALVTKISTSRVRTTHLTGLFTDLGIELSQLFFYRNTVERQQLRKNIFLKMIIIVFFFTGGTLGGILFAWFRFSTFLFAASVLLVAMYYDLIRYRLYAVKRRLL